MNRFILCADDFGLNQPVNEAVFKLIEKQRLNAVSCMVGGDGFGAGYAQLEECVNGASFPIQIGLHLTLSQYKPLAKMPQFAPADVLPGVVKLLVSSHLGMLPVTEIKNEIALQCQRFIDVTGRKPDFIDGHQHVHVLPAIRKLVADVAPTVLAPNGWIRNCYVPPARLRQYDLLSNRARLISRLAKPHDRLLRRRDIRSNDSFAGINDFNRVENYGLLMRKWLALAAANPAGTLIMCHPGLSTAPLPGVHDPIAERRPDEFSYLSSNRFLEDLEDKDLSFNLERDAVG